MRDALEQEGNDRIEQKWLILQSRMLDRCRIDYTQSCYMYTPCLLDGPTNMLPGYTLNGCRTATPNIGNYYW